MLTHNIRNYGGDSAQLPQSIIKNSESFIADDCDIIAKSPQYNSSRAIEENKTP